jgi:hypothetical protein
MTRRKIKPGAIGSDVDLDIEEVYLPDGRRLTEQLAEDMAQRALAPRRWNGGTARPNGIP